MKRLTLKTISLLCMLATVLVSCDKDESGLTPNENYIQNIEDQPQGFGNFIADIDGSNFSMTATLTNNIQPTVGGQESTDATVSPFVTQKNYNSALTNSSTGQSSGISVGEIIYSGSLLPSKSEFLALFSTGSKNYSQDLSNGVEVYIVENNVVWSSANGSGNQSGSKFNITSATEGSVLGNDNVEIEATFSCTLYDDSGNSKVLTNGTFKGVFENS